MLVEIQGHMQLSYEILNSMTKLRFFRQVSDSIGCFDPK
jgi:hypothetical protein